MMLLNANKQERQKLGVSKYVSAGGIGIINYPAGFGKTHTGILCAIELFKTDAKEDDSLLVIVPSVGVKQHWMDVLNTFDFKEYGCEFKYEITTIHEIKEPSNVGNPTMVILDEYHKFTSDLRIQLVEFLVKNIRYVLGLTATLPFGSKLMRDVAIPIVDTISEKVAINAGWISNFVEYNIPLEFTDFDKEQYSKLSTPISAILDIFKNSAYLLNGTTKVFDSDFDAIFGCFYGKTVYVNNESYYITSDKIRTALSNRRGWHPGIGHTLEGRDIEKYYSPTSIENYARGFMELIRSRNNLLIYNHTKLEAILKLVSLSKIPTIIFNESTEFADLIAESLGSKAIVYHSNVKSRPIPDPITGDYIRYKSGKKAGEPKMFGKDNLRKMAIEGMKDGTYDVIISAKALDEGIDIPNLERVITSGGTTNPMTYTQRAGRGKRVDVYNPEKVTHIYNFYFDDFYLKDGELVKSRDKSKLIMRQKGNSNVIWLNSIEELFI